MNGYKKHLISQRIAANSFKSETIDSFKSEAPAPPVREKVPAGRQIKLKNFLGAGFKWPLKIEKSEPGAPAEEPGHRRKGSFLLEKLKKPADECPTEKHHSRHASNSVMVFRVVVFIQNLKNRFFRFMETLFLLDSPADLALISEVPFYQPVMIENAGLARKAEPRGFPIKNLINRRGYLKNEPLAEKITSIAARYRNLENQPLTLAIKSQAFRQAKMMIRSENDVMMAGYA